MRKNHTIILLTVAIVVGVGLLVFTLIQPQGTKSDNQSFEVETNSKPILTSTLHSSILEGLADYGFEIEARKLETVDISYYRDRWVFVRAILVDEPLESEARDMMYVMKRIDDDRLALVAFSGDGFTPNSFDESIPQDVVEEAIKRW